MNVSTSFFVLSLTLLLPSLSYAQTQVTESVTQNTAAVVLGGTGGGGGGTSTTKLKNNPDGASAIGTSNNPNRYCEPYQVGSWLFGQAATSQCFLDEGAEARDDSSHFANLAVTMNNMGLEDAAMNFAYLAGKRMFMTRDTFVASWPEENVFFEELWHP